MGNQFVRSLNQPDRINRIFCLGLTSFPLVGTWIYRQSNSVPFLSCPIRALIGIPCPSCGMTRSFLALAKGDLGESIFYHLFGPLLFLTFLIVTVHTAIELVMRRKVFPPYYKKLYQLHLHWIGLASFLGYYVIRLSIGKITGVFLF